MRYRIAQKKLTFIWHLQNLDDDSLAKEIFQAQRLQNLPGLVKECDEWMAELKLPSVYENKYSKCQWKRMVKSAIYKENEKDLKTKMKEMEKLKESDMIKEKCETKPYITNLSVTDAINIFKKRVSMTRHVKRNYMSELRYIKDLR